MRLALLLWLLCGPMPSVWASSVFLQWVSPTTLVDGQPLTDLAGHRLYQGAKSGVYDSILPVPTGTTATVAGLIPGTYYWAVTAVRANGLESAPSAEASLTIPGDTTPPTVQITAPVDGTTVPRKGAVTIRATAQDDQEVALVRIYVNGALHCTVGQAEASCQWRVPAANHHVYRLMAQAVDTSGLVGTSPVVTVTAE